MILTKGDSNLLAYFPTPYEDELFYSVIARYHIHSGNLNFVDTIRDLYGKTQLKAIPDLSICLNSVCKNLEIFNYLSQDELLEKHTMYFYYTNFTSLEIKEQTKKIIFYENNLRAYRILGILGNKIKEHKFFRFCNKCLEEDFQKYGENYWHLTHQLPSVIYCHKHPDEILLDSEIWYRKGSRTEFKSASFIEIGFQNSSELKFIEKNKDILKRITKESVKLATKRYNWDLENIHEVYRVMLNSKGYLNAKGTVNQTKLGGDLLKYFGEELLEYLNCELRIGDNNCWLRLITSKNRSIFHPLKHAENTHIQDFTQIYKYLMQVNGYANHFGKMHQQYFTQQFKPYYGEEFLTLTDCNFDEHSDTSWIRSIVRKHRKAFHPVQHLQLLQFLNVSFKDLENFIGKKYEPFGQAPYYCLNPAADHYKQRVISTVAITTCTDTRKPVGTFSCDCGFVYSRRGPDEDKADSFKVGRIKSFGSVWQAKLIQLATSGLSPNRIAQVLECDYATVKKYMTSLKDKSLNNKEPLMDLRIRKETEWLKLNE